jgi:hypothetical protein
MTYLLEGGYNYSGPIGTDSSGEPLDLATLEAAKALWVDLADNGYHQGFPLFGAESPDDVAVWEVDNNGEHHCAATVADCRGWRFVVGRNIPGYVGEAEPFYAETWDEAVDYLIEELDREADYLEDVRHDADDDDQGAYRDAIEEYGRAIAELDTVERRGVAGRVGPSWSAVLPLRPDSSHDLGMAWWIETVGGAA